MKCHWNNNIIKWFEKKSEHGSFKHLNMLMVIYYENNKYDEMFECFDKLINNNSSNSRNGIYNI
jgi:hypothetical protein